jgi:hypothetical protein
LIDWANLGDWPNLLKRGEHYFLHHRQGQTLLPAIAKQFANGAAASTPPLDEMLAAWRAIK